MFEDKYVLTVDDSDTLRAYLRNVLTPLGASVEGAATGQEGLEKCAGRRYDLILLDLLLPDMDGIEVLKRIRETNDTSPIVMVTGHGGIESAIAAVQLGADGYIQKQDITFTINDHTEFLYALEQAFEHRTGIVAQKQLQQVRADFYSMVTHDLRNPTGIISSATQMLMEGSVGPLTPDQQEFVSLIQTAAERLYRLINDYLDFAKIDAGYLRLDLGEVDLCKVVETSAHMARLQAQAKQQTLSLDLPPDPVPAHADAERLTQVFDNLLSNAIKYTSEGGYIAFKLRVENGQAVFRVSDTGMGIPREAQPALFAKYHRLPGKATRGIHGSGLGLLIVKEIVEAHGGTVQIESEGVRGKGTTFSVRIPLSHYPAGPSTSEASNQVGPLPTEEVESPPIDVSPDHELYRLFVEESQNHILVLRDSLTRLHSAPQDQAMIEKAHLACHTLKGNASAMQLREIGGLASQMEDVLKQAAKGPLELTSNHVRDLDQLLSDITDALSTQHYDLK